MVRRYANSDSGKKCVPVFIIGLPRSGSTVLYQLITDIFDVLYFDNLVNIGRENIYFSMRLSELLFKNRPHQSYSSSFGNTYSDGLHAPSEAGPLWYRWFPKNVSEVTPEMVSDKKKKDLRLLFSSLMNRSGKPLVVKNLFTVQRMKVLKEIFPEAKYIYISRDPFFIAQSIYLGRKMNLVDIDSEWWSVPFPGYESMIGLPAEKQIANQIFELERIIQNELRDVDKDNVVELNYESLDLEIIRKELGSFLNARFREGFSAEKVNLQIENKIKTDAATVEAIQSELNSIFES
ncbi:MAG: sulfotransferase [Bacteroidales bacterium]